MDFAVDHPILLSVLLSRVLPIVLRTGSLVLVLIGKVCPVCLHQIGLIILVGSAHHAHLLLNLPLRGLGSVARLGEHHHPLILLEATVLIWMLVNLLSIVYIIERLGIEHVVLLCILLLHLLHLIFLVNAYTFFRTSIILVLVSSSG